jgi:hypothetical protein
MNSETFTYCTGNKALLYAIYFTSRKYVHGLCVKFSLVSHKDKFAPLSNIMIFAKMNEYYCSS